MENEYYDQYQITQLFPDNWVITTKEIYNRTDPKERRIVREKVDEKIPVSKKEPLKHDFYVMRDYDGKFHVWSKKEYETYIIWAVMVGGGSAFKIVTGFNADENYLFPEMPKEQNDDKINL